MSYFWNNADHIISLYGFYTLYELDNILSNNIEYWVTYGTLLGIIRDNTLIDGDSDLDIATFIYNRDNIQKILIANNYLFMEEVYISNLIKSDKFLSPTGCLVDVTYVHEFDGQYFMKSFLPINSSHWYSDGEYRYIDYNDNYIKEGIIQYKVSDKITVSIPKNYRQLLHNYYGNYATPISNFFSTNECLKVDGVLRTAVENKKHSRVVYLVHDDIINQENQIILDIDKIGYSTFNEDSIRKVYKALFNLYPYRELKVDAIDQRQKNIERIVIERDSGYSRIINKFDKKFKRLNFILCILFSIIVGLILYLLVDR